MQKFTLTAMLFSAATIVFAQKEINLKLYQNTDFFPVQNPPSQQVKFNRFSLAASLQGKRKLVHELELFIPEISKPIDQASFPMTYEFYGETSNTKNTFTSFSFRYELSTILHQSKRLAFGLGGGINPYYTKTESVPLVPFVFYRYAKKYGFSLNFIPRVMYTISAKILLDLNIPIKVYDLREEEQKIGEPRHPHSSTNERRPG